MHPTPSKVPTTQVTLAATVPFHKQTPPTYKLSILVTSVASPPTVNDLGVVWSHKMVGNMPF